MACLITASLVINQAYASDATITVDGNELYASEEDAPRFMDKLQGAVENIDNGVVITVTSDDVATVEKLQNMPDAFAEDGRGGPFEEMFDVDQTVVTKTVESLENGVKITLTSDDVTVVEKLQSQAEEFAKFDPPAEINVSRTVENIDNGVVVTITSDDANVVKMLQENEGEMRHHGHGIHNEQDEND